MLLNSLVDQIKDFLSNFLLTGQILAVVQTAKFMVNLFNAKQMKIGKRRFKIRPQFGQNFEVWSIVEVPRGPCLPSSGHL